jgi:hypothetical protein
VAKLVSIGWSWLSDWRGEIPAKVNSYHGGRLSTGGRVTQDNLLGSLLCHCEERDSSLTLGTSSAIPMGSQTRLPRPDKSGLAITKRAWCWMKETATKGWRRDLRMRVSSLFLAPVAQTSPDFSYRLVSAAGHGSPSLRGTIMPKQSRTGMRLPRPFSGARNDRSVGGFTPIRGEMAVTSRTTISAHEASSTGRVPVGRGR